jgi:hypothetical protein
MFEHLGAGLGSGQIVNTQAPVPADKYKLPAGRFHNSITRLGLIGLGTLLNQIRRGLAFFSLVCACLQILKLKATLRLLSRQQSLPRRVNLAGIQVSLCLGNFLVVDLAACFLGSGKSGHST